MSSGSASLQWCCPLLPLLSGKVPCYTGTMLAASARQKLLYPSVAFKSVAMEDGQSLR